MDESSEKIQFSWGKRRGKGGAKMDTQFYDSFTFDNVKYSLYDCVYLFKSGDPEPYIGKIVKIWEQNQAKKVKILWFFLPDEIQKYLGGPVMEKEIFLASGDGIGLADINPLEAIAGKCTVICISKDERNRQPSPSEQAMADYIFYRFFDVRNCTLSDQLPDKITGLEVNLLLNPKDEQVTSIRGATNVDEGLIPTVPPPQSAVKEEDESPVAAAPLSQPAVMEEDKIPVAAVSLSQSVVKEDQKPVAASPLSPSVVKKEYQKPPVAIPLSQSVIKEDEKPVASTPLPLSAVMENIPKHTHNAPSGERPPKKLKLPQEVTVQNMPPAVPDKRPSELTSRQTDRSRWFKIPWDDRLRIADEQGTLVYIQNLDIQFGAADIEELIHEALQLNCIAKPINHPTYDDPNNGKAYAIFRTKSAADRAISEINSGLVVGGRPLYCSKGLLKVPKPAGTLVGHLSMYNIKITQKQREEQKKAVSTSHCSQPNTIEYDLALDWMLAREKQERKFRILHKWHKDGRKAFASMGSKNTKIGK
ncbi:protein ANTI-SILENCING 1-like [Phragmites australis]|uniref:protein ANTI-SILENCING 1-like n=1 Tax=Phragmites australis TaxID=29695 RepID=UPI002D77BCBC|nr:protein ANTI-SILENCING 1-like [Phragmites australis]